MDFICGFKTEGIDETTAKTIEYFKNSNIQKIYIGHCTSDDVIQEFEKELGNKCVIEKLFVGKEFKI